MINNGYDNIKIPENIDKIIEVGAKKASLKKKKSRNKKAIIIAASLSVIITFGIVAQPVLAEKVPILDYLYKSFGLSRKNMEDSTYSGREINVKGFKITIGNIVASRNRIIVSSKIEASKEVLDKYNGFSPIDVYAETEKYNSNIGGGKTIRVSDSELLIIQDSVSDTDFENTGKLKIKLLGPEVEVDDEITIDIKFEDNYDKTVKLSLRSERELDNLIVEGIESTATGTLLNAKEIGVGYGKGQLYSLKVDDVIYRESGASFTDSSGYIIFDNLHYEDMINAKEIYLVKENFYNVKTKSSNIDLEGLAMEEKVAKIDEVYKNEREKKDKLIDTVDSNVHYVKKFDFENGNNAEMYNIRRADGKMKISIKGTTKNEAYALASLISIKSVEDEYDSTIYLNNIRITEEGYELEFDDVIKGNVKIVIPPFAEDYYDAKILDEIKLLVHNK